ncbi:MAG: SGNH/GDSL hydrolase family protein [Candidatus Hydrogenedentes bacterium]|nr:SGNH/GDSL hydrolase family protein [Candidatus Hydrogenedentota bacterium]
MRMHRSICLLAVIAIFLPSPLCAEEEKRWEKAIQTFEQRDAENPPPKGEILFIGSSSIRMWKTAEDFPEYTIINRGFGGSQTADSVEFAARIAIPYEPRLVVLYAGDNDIAAGKSPEQVAEDARAFFKTIHDALPKTRIAYIAIKPSILRWEMVEKMRAANALIRAHTETVPHLQFIDIDTPMLGGDGKPRASLFIQDGLHLSREGYDLWNAIIRPYLSEESE